MAYSKLLNKIISNTNYTQEEIAQKCCNLGVKLSREKVNALQNYRSKPPKYEVSRAIAKVCNADERLLVTEGYFDNAPEEVKQVLKDIQYFINTIALLTVTNLRNLNTEDINQIQQYLEKETISETLIQIMEEKENSIKLFENNLNYSEDILGNTINFNVPYGIDITDNGMSPLIEKGNQVILNIKNNYDTSNIVAYQDNKEHTKVRILTKVNNTLVMIPLNKNYKKEIYSTDDINILGEITKVIKDI